jgi:small subunit ribosomal protein S4e
MNGREATFILNDKEGGIQIDHKIRRDKCFPVGIMDVVQVPKTKESFRVLYDVKGRFVLKPIE